MGEQGWNVAAYTCACHPGVMWGIGGDIGPTLSSSPEAADASTFWYGVGAWTAGPAADARTFVGLDDLRAAHPDLTSVAVDNVAALLADHARVVRELDEQRQRAVLTAERDRLAATIADLAKTGDEALDELGRLGTDEGLRADNERLTAELDETRKRVAHYERCIDWDATCKACAAGMDVSYELAMRAEEAEADRDRLEAERDEARAKRDQVVKNAVAWMAEARHQAVERDRLADAIRRVRELHSPEPGWEQEWKDPAKALAAGWPLCRGCRTGTCARRVEDCPTLAALGDAAAAKPAACCDLHGRNCEPPSELCCPDCTEAAHDTFPIRHADGSTCSAPDLSGTQPEPGPARAGRFEELFTAEHEQFDRRGELLRSIVEYRDAPSTTVAALGDVGADPDGEQKTAHPPAGADFRTGPDTLSWADAAARVSADAQAIEASREDLAEREGQRYADLARRLGPSRGRLAQRFPSAAVEADPDWACQKCQGPLTPCVACWKPAQCGDSWCADCTPGDEPAGSGTETGEPNA